MPQRSKIEQLPPEIREELDAKLIKGGFSDYEGLSDWLAENGFEIGKSSIHRYGSSFEERISALQMITRQAEAIVKEAPDDSGAVNDALIRLVQEKVFSILLDMEINPAKVNLNGLVRNVADLSRASVSQKRLKQEIRTQDRAALDAAVAAGDINAEAANEARRILGFE